MKIDQGRTLSQFVDNLPIGHTELDALRFIEVKKYNEFLKQPLKKEMFVNEIEKPIKEDYGNHSNNVKMYLDDLKAWQEAEKKVIFEGFEIKEYDTGDKSIHYKDVIHVFWYNSVTRTWTLAKGVKSLAKVFELTNGTLKMKNLEI